MGEEVRFLPSFKGMSMTTKTMVYRAASDVTDPAHVIENEAGKWEWQIVDLEDGAGAPEGWKSLPVDIGEATAPKTKRAKIKLPNEIVVDTDGNSDGN